VIILNKWDKIKLRQKQDLELKKSKKSKPINKKTETKKETEQEPSEE
tara:strand:- start:210 stop:350 length:141 start_codon:yes stop_codon:yes gene_type:complete